MEFNEEEGENSLNLKIIEYEKELKRKEREIEEKQKKLEEREKEFERSKIEFEKEKGFFREGMFRIDRSTPSIEDMETTMSELRIEQSREYLELGHRVFAKIEVGEMTGDEGRRLLDEKVIELKRYMDNRRKREARASVSASRKKVERDYQTLKDVGRDKCEFGMEIIKNKLLIEENGFSVNIPAQDEFINRAMTMQHNILTIAREKEKKVFDRPQHSCMAHVTIGGVEKFYTNTSKTPVLTPDGVENKIFYEILCQKIRQILDRADDYEQRSSTIVCAKIMITYTISQWESIRNWYPDFDDVPRKNKIREFLDFSVFLAPDEDISCEQQCVEYLGGIWDPSKEIEYMIPQKELIIYVPCQGDMRYVKKFDDLMSGYNKFAANTLDCKKDVARIIKWNEHVAVITKIKPREKRLRVQSKRKINVDIQNPTEVFVDIEAFGKKSESNYTEHVPYLVCWSDGDEINHLHGEDCMAEFVEMILEKYSAKPNSKGDIEYNSITMYAWYGSGYDYQHFYPHLKKRCTYDECKLKNNSIIYAKFEFEPIKLTIHLKDPYLFILTSLDKAAKGFGVLNKSSFPHEIIKDWKDLDKTLDHWVTLRSRVIEEYNGKQMIVSVESWEEYDELPNKQTILEKAIEYCTIDVMAMQQIWIKFSALAKEHLGIPITPSIFTLSQLSMKLMETCLPDKIWMYVPKRDQYNFIKNAIYGGRVIAKNGNYREQILYADVVSLYPSAMKLLKHSYGKAFDVNKINWNKQGVYEVTLTHKCDIKPEEYLEFVPRRIDNKLHWNWFKQHRGIYHTYDLLIAKEEGFRIECHKGIEYQSQGYIFNDFIDKLYTLKEGHSRCKCGEQPCPIRWIAKIALNGGGYGKFVQKPIDVDTYIVRRDVIAGECARMPENENGEIFFGGMLIKRPQFHNLDGDDYDKMIIETEHNTPNYSTQIGVSILSGSRYRLYNLCKKFHNIEIIYSDTDSIFVKKNSVNYQKFIASCGSNLGQLDDTIGNTSHGIISHMIVGGPKMYAYEYHDQYGIPQFSLHCKGVPTSMLSMKQFEHMLQNDASLSYHFAIMKRRIVGVKGLDIEKQITQT